MDNIKEYEAKLSSYNKTIETAKQACDKADRDLLVTETEQKQFENRLNEIRESCIQTTGVNIEELPQLLESKMGLLDSIMTTIETKFGTGGNFDVTTAIDNQIIDELEIFADNNNIQIEDEF